MSSNLAGVMAKVVEVLSPLTSEERVRVVNAALTLLGEGEKSTPAAGAPTTASGSSAANLGDQSDISPQARAWLTRNSLTKHELENWFHFDQGRVTPIAIPANASTRTEQAINTYLLQGFAAFLASGDAAFGDQEARDLCEHFGCYDKTNHSKVFKSFGNKITGSKSTGWKLTAPGINAAGGLIKNGGSL
jgi:hypothetical protein